jgi:hypothetical protein
MLGSPEWRGTDEGKVNLSFSLPRQGVSLLTLQW